LASPLLKNEGAGLQAALRAEGVEPDDFLNLEPDSPDRIPVSVRFATWLLAENHMYQAAILNRVVHTLVILGLKDSGVCRPHPNEQTAFSEMALGCLHTNMC